MPRFRSSSKTPKEVVSELKETLLYLTQQTTDGASKWPKKHKKSGRKHAHEQSEVELAKAAGEEAAGLLASLKTILYGSELQSDVVKQCFDLDMLLYLVRGTVLEELPSPTARRDVVRIFRYFLERETDSTVKYIIKNQALISNLISGYDTGKAQVVANCGLMLRACTRYKSLVWVILLLKSDDVMQFFDFVQAKQFEVLADAFVTFKELLKHEDLTAKFLEENHDEIFKRLSGVLSSDYYVTKHVGLEWLQDLLNESSCMREYYCSSTQNLKTVMTLLGSDPSVTIRFKALDLLQAFLMVTEKERGVSNILLSNREKMEALVSELLTKFDKDAKRCPEPGRTFLLKTLQDPELTPALWELTVEDECLTNEELEVQREPQEIKPLDDSNLHEPLSIEQPLLTDCEGSHLVEAELTDTEELPAQQILSSKPNEGESVEEAIVSERTPEPTRTTEEHEDSGDNFTEPEKEQNKKDTLNSQTEEIEVSVSGQCEEGEGQPPNVSREGEPPLDQCENERMADHHEGEQQPSNHHGERETHSERTESLPDQVEVKEPLTTEGEGELFDRSEREEPLSSHSERDEPPSDPSHHPEREESPHHSEAEEQSSTNSKMEEPPSSHTENEQPPSDRAEGEEPSSSHSDGEEAISHHSEIQEQLSTDPEREQPPSSHTENEELPSGHTEGEEHPSSHSERDEPGPSEREETSLQNSETEEESSADPKRELVESDDPPSHRPKIDTHLEGEEFPPHCPEGEEQSSNDPKREEPPSSLLETEPFSEREKQLVEPDYPEQEIQPTDPPQRENAEEKPPTDHYEGEQPQPEHVQPPDYQHPEEHLSSDEDPLTDRTEAGPQPEHVQPSDYQHPEEQLSSDEDPLTERTEEGPQPEHVQPSDYQHPEEQLSSDEDPLTDRTEAGPQPEHVQPSDYQHPEEHLSSYEDPLTERTEEGPQPKHVQPSVYQHPEEQLSSDEDPLTECTEEGPQPEHVQPSVYQHPEEQLSSDEDPLTNHTEEGPQPEHVQLSDYQHPEEQLSSDEDNLTERTEEGLLPASELLAQFYAAEGEKEAQEPLLPDHSEDEGTLSDQDKEERSSGEKHQTEQSMEVEQVSDCHKVDALSDSIEGEELQIVDHNKSEEAMFGHPERTETLLRELEIAEPLIGHFEGEYPPLGHSEGEEQSLADCGDKEGTLLSGQEGDKVITHLEGEEEVVNSVDEGELIPSNSRIDDQETQLEECNDGKKSPASQLDDEEDLPVPPQVEEHTAVQNKEEDSFKDELSSFNSKKLEDEELPPLSTPHQTDSEEASTATEPERQDQSREEFHPGPEFPLQNLEPKPEQVVEEIPTEIEVLADEGCRYEEEKETAESAVIADEEPPSILEQIVEITAQQQENGDDDNNQTQDNETTSTSTENTNPDPPLPDNQDEASVDLLTETPQEEKTSEQEEDECCREDNQQKEEDEVTEELQAESEAQRDEKESSVEILQNQQDELPQPESYL